MDTSKTHQALSACADFPRPTTVGIVLFPGFSMMALASAGEPLRAANLLSGNTLYRTVLISAVESDPVSSGGIRITTDLHDLEVSQVDLLLVVASLDFEHLLTPLLLSKLRQCAKPCRVVGAVGFGSLVLAKAGLLDGYRCTGHWECLRDLKIRHPEVVTTGDIYCIDHDRWTCSGGTAAIDMMLALIRSQHGASLALQVANNFIHGRARQSDELQPMEMRWRYGVKDRRLAKAIGFMEQSIEVPLRLIQVASLVGLSTRQLQRLFMTEMKQTPEQFYIRLRLKMAMDLLEQTDDAVSSIAMQCGFADPSHFTQTFQNTFGMSPSGIRHARKSTGPR
jgi:transcriptional regulator GlxA family with amidase domain